LITDNLKISSFKVNLSVILTSTQGLIVFWL